MGQQSFTVSNPDEALAKFKELDKCMQELEVCGAAIQNALTTTDGLSGLASMEQVVAPKYTDMQRCITQIKETYDQFSGTLGDAVTWATEQDENVAEAEQMAAAEIDKAMGSLGL